MSTVPSPVEPSGAFAPKALNSKNFGAVCLLLVLIDVVVLLPRCFSWRWPPSLNDAWIFVSIVGSVAAGFGVEGARTATSRSLRAFSNFGLTLASLTLLVPFYMYFQNFHDFPWVIAVPIAIALAAGCVVARNYLVLAGMAVFFGGLLIPSATVPSRYFPVTKSVSGLQITLKSLSEVEFRMADGSDPRTHFDIENTTSELLVGPFARTEGRSPSRLMNDDGTESTTRFSIHEFLPDHTKTVGLRLRLAEWPALSEAEVTVDVPRRGALKLPSGVDNKGPIHLMVSNIRWGASKTTFASQGEPTPQVLLFQAEYSGYSYSGSKGNEISVRDDLGNAYRLLGSSVNGTDHGAKEDLEIQNLNANAHKLIFRAYSEAQSRAAQRVITFNYLQAEQPQP